MVTMRVLAGKALSWTNRTRRSPVYGGAGRASLNSLLYVIIRLQRQTDPDNLDKIIISTSMNSLIFLAIIPSAHYCPCSWGNSPGQALFVTRVLPWRIF